jgi:hypothetical protein
MRIPNCPRGWIPPPNEDEPDALEYLEAYYQDPYYYMYQMRKLGGTGVGRKIARRIIRKGERYEKEFDS